MLLIGETLNSSIPRTLEAIRTRNTEYLTELITLQERSGAEYLDLNTALTKEDELKYMEWLISLISEHTNCGISIDSPDPEIIQKVLSVQKGRPILVNSVSLDSKYETLFGEIAFSNASVIGLPMKSGQIPQTVTERVANAKQLTQKLTQAGIAPKQIFVDILVEPIATAPSSPAVAIETIRAIKVALPEVKTVCGLSNVSFGLPERADLNSAFLAMCMEAGLDAAILDITSKEIQKTLSIGKALLGQDPFGMDYISFIREGK